LWHNSFL